MKKIWMIAGGILLALIVGAGGFWGGMTYQSNQVSQAQANFINARGGRAGSGVFSPADGQLPGDLPREAGQFPGDGPAVFGIGGTTGQVKTVDGNTITISTAEDVTTVNLSDATVVQKIETGDITDVNPGMRVMVTGQRDDHGNITASQVTILDSSSDSTTGQPAAGREP